MSLRGLSGAVGFLREHERLVAISISTVLVMAGQGVISPVLPLFAKDFGVGAATIGLTLSMFALARLLLNVPLGVLSDRYGRRVLLVSGPVVTAAGMVGSGLSGNIEQLLAWRFLAGVGSAMYQTAAMAYIADISLPANRARFIGTNQGALLLGVSIGPGVGGLIAQGFGLRAPFYVVGGAALLAAVYGYLRLPETHSRTVAPAAPAVAPGPPDGGGQRSWLRMVRSRDFAALSFVTMATFLARAAGRQTLVPLMSVARLNMSPAALGGIFSAMAFMGMLLITPAAIAADRFGRKAMIVPGGALVGAGLLLYAGAGTYTLFLVASLVMALGQGVGGPAPGAYAADIAPDDARGLAMGLYRSAGDIGFVIGPPLLGALADATSFSWALAVNGLIVIAAAVTFLSARETAGPRRVARPAREAQMVEGGGEG